MRCTQIYIFLTLVVFVSSGCVENSRLEQVAELKHYASGSGMSYFRDRVYLIGDDMNYLLVTDTTFRPVDSIQLTEGTGRIPKDRKSDLESVSIIRGRDGARLFIAGSGSLFPTRNKAWMLNLQTKEKSMVDLDTFYKRIQSSRVKEVN